MPSRKRGRREPPVDVDKVLAEDDARRRRSRQQPQARRFDPWLGSYIAVAASVGVEQDIEKLARQRRAAAQPSGTGNFDSARARKAAKAKESAAKRKRDKQKAAHRAAHRRRSENKRVA